MLNTVLRAVRSVLRHPLRTALVALLLALGIGFSMSMLVVDAAVSDRIDELKTQFGNDIEVRPAGFFGGAAGFGGGGFGPLGPGGQNGEDEDSAQPAISSEVLDQIEALPGVSSVQKTAQAQYAGDDLASSFTPPAGSDFGGATLPITIIGTSTSNRLDVVGGGTAQIIEGMTFPSDASSPDEALDTNTAIVGVNLAEQNNLSVGSTFEVEGEPIEVIGIYDAGQSFGNNSLFMPYETLRRLYALEGASEVRVFTDSADDVDEVAAAIRTSVGEDVVDVITATDQVSNFAGYLDQAGDNTRTGLYASLVGSVLIIVASVTLAARQRVLEMGILKAIGASHLHVVGQFSVETLALSVSAALLGALLTFPIAQRVSNTLVDAPQQQGPFQGAAQGAAPQGGGGFFGGGSAATDLAVSVSTDVFIYALGFAVVLGLLASVLITWYAVRVKPMEVLRAA